MDPLLLLAALGMTIVLVAVGGRVWGGRQTGTWLGLPIGSATHDHGDAGVVRGDGGGDGAG